MRHLYLRTKALTHCVLGKDFGGCHRVLFCFLLFFVVFFGGFFFCERALACVCLSEDGVWHFMQVVYLGDNLCEVSGSFV